MTPKPTYKVRARDTGPTRVAKAMAARRIPKTGMATPCAATLAAARSTLPRIAQKEAVKEGNLNL